MSHRELSLKYHAFILHYAALSTEPPLPVYDCGSREIIYLMTSILILNGPNLNLLGQRQPEIYGKTSLSDIKAMCQVKADALSVSLAFEQSNSEGTLIDMIHASKGQHDGIILNAGAYTHTSVALMDAIISVELPVIELHLSNIHAREEFRHQSYIAKAALGVICGFGATGYELSLDAMVSHITKTP